MLAQLAPAVPAVTAAPVAGPFLALGVGIAVVVLAIARWKVHAFFALMLAAISVGLVVTLGGFGTLTLIGAVEKPVAEFGLAAGRIGFVIVMAAVIGECLTVSGGAERIVLWLLAVFGEKRAGVALLTAGFVLSIPVFFDTVFLLLLPVARALAVRTGRDGPFYVLAMCAGAVITHSTVPPTPGPLLVAEALKLDLAVAIGGGIACGILPALGGLAVARWINGRLPGLSLAAAGAPPVAAGTALPGLLPALAPVVLPLGLIAGASVADALHFGGWAADWVAFAGNKHVALFVGMSAALALALVRPAAGSAPRPRLATLLGAPLESAGVIILITAAGGAFGAMLREAGLAGAVTSLAAGRELNFVLLGWLLAAVVRVAQGSATVAMITATGMLTAVAGERGFGDDAFWVFLAVGYGATVLSWMNDSGFWLISRMCGWDERTTLRSWTVLLTAISVFGLVEALVLSALF